MSTQVLRIHITIHKDSSAVMVPVSKATAKNSGDNRVIAFFSHFNPFNWFNGFRDVQISLEEFASKRQ
jgi:hypothetical protein